MKTLFLSFLIMFFASPVMAGLPPHVLVVMPKSVWVSSDKTKMKTVFRELTNAPQAIGFSVWKHEETGEDWYVACYWTEHLDRLSDKISQVKIDQLKSTLTSQKIVVKFSTDPKSDLAAMKLFLPRDEVISSP